MNSGYSAPYTRAIAQRMIIQVFIPESWYGVFATTLIEEGSFIVEYRGVLRGAAECSPDSYSYYFIYNNTRYCIDASVDDGSLGRLVNDDSNPNAKMKIISISRIPHLCLFALRDIQPGEEITYDYGGYDLPWRRGTWLCTENPARIDHEEGECEEPPAESDTKEQQVSDVELRASNEEASESQLTHQVADGTVRMECNEEPKQQILEQQHTSMEVDACVEEQSCPVSAAQQPCENEEENHPACSVESPAVKDQQVGDVELGSSTEEASESQLTHQMTDEVGKMECNEEPEQILEQQQTCVEEQSCPVSAAQARAKIARHLKLHRNASHEIATAFKLRKNSRQRAHILEVLRNRGNYQHNKLVLVNGTGLIKVRKRPKYDIDTQNYEYCMYCKGLYMRKELWKHVKRCLSNPEGDRQKKSRSVSGVTALWQSPHLKNISEDVKKMLCDLHQDEVAKTIRNDEYVLKLAQDFFDQKGSSKGSHAFVRHTVRCIGEFLILLRSKYKIRHLAEAIKPSNFPVLTEAVKEIADFIEEKQCFGIPSLARRIGLALRKYCILSAKKAYAVRDRRLEKATVTFMQLFNNALSQFALGEKKTAAQAKPFLMPFVNDVRIFHCYLEKAAQRAVKQLRERPSAQRYADLCKVTLAQILMFNRRHGEVSQMTIKSFHERDERRDVQAPEISEALTELEKVFCADFCKILVRQNVGVLVPIILTPDMINALMLLIEKRDQCSVPRSNTFVFGQPRNNRYYRGENALQICAKESGATNPRDLTSTKLSRHVSTLCQVLTMKNHELKNLAKFIGYDISLSKEYYRESEAMPRLAKICKLILAIERGLVSDVLGQSLDDTVLPDEITESDSEDEYFEEDDDDFPYNTGTRPKTPSIPAPTPKKQENESTSKKQENEYTSKEQENESTSKEQENESTSKEQDKPPSTSEEPQSTTTE
ncbi:uncharacterized protein DAT39_014070, partial [Clarias magur]